MAEGRFILGNRDRRKTGGINSPHDADHLSLSGTQTILAMSTVQSPGILAGAVLNH